MKKITIELSQEQYEQWLFYSEKSSLPIEHMIKEAVTYSVNNDRLGVYSGITLFNRINKKKPRQKELSSQNEIVNNDTEHESEYVNMSNEYSSLSDHTALEDSIPSNL